MSKKDLSSYVTGANHFRITIRVILITVVVIGSIAAFGWYMDKTFGTKPVGLISGLVIGFPMTQLIIYKTFKKFSETTNE